MSSTKNTPKGKNIVVAPQPLAVEAGAEMFHQGGNAIDAAVGTAFAQAVIDPSMTSIGGFGTMLVYLASTKQVIEISFHGTVPGKAQPTVTGTYTVANYTNQIGYLAPTVPGSVKGLCQAHEEYGRLSLWTVMEPAIRLAYDGWIVRPDQWRVWTEPAAPGRLPEIRRFNATATASAIYTNNGELLEVGQKVVNADYGRTLEAIAEKGPDVFYKGEIAKKIAEDFRKNDGLIDEADLANYQTVTASPLCLNYRNYHVYGAIPPAGGLVTLEMLNILEGFDLQELEYNSAEYIHLVSRAMRIAFRDMRNFLGDPKFVFIPTDRLLSPGYAVRCRENMDAGKGCDSVDSSHSNTTHVSTVDADGNAVSLTHSVAASSGVVIPGLGFIFNGQMHRFNPVPGHANSIAPGKRRITGMAPCLVFRDGELFMVLGAPGGHGIITGVLQTIINAIDFRMPVMEAISLPRFHCEGETITIESRVPSKTVLQLEKMGNRVDHSLFSYHRVISGRVHAICVDPNSGEMKGAADPRDGGMALYV
ncbi:MAG: gamma-glutamyltransferase [Deltaproteobacteria bacterium]|nr:gamma-glutamyltransferase [Deltaproteobacteria bacterium]